jgi:hypothetical protein
LPLKKPEKNRGHVEESEPVKLTTDFANEKALLHKVFFEGESPDTFLRLIAHPEKAHRVKIASALAAINIEFTHDEESGFPEKRRQFWVDVKEHLPNIINALCAAQDAGDAFAAMVEENEIRAQPSSKLLNQTSRSAQSDQVFKIHIHIKISTAI